MGGSVSGRGSVESGGKVEEAVEGLLRPLLMNDTPVWALGEVLRVQLSGLLKGKVRCVADAVEIRYPKENFPVDFLRFLPFQPAAVMGRAQTRRMMPFSWMTK